MKLITLLPYVADFHASARKVVEMDKAGVDAVLVAEACSFDAISQVGYLAAITEGPALPPRAPSAASPVPL